MATHKTRLLAYLKQYGSITSLQAIQDLGNTRLAAYIFILRDEGHTIKGVSITISNRWGTKTTITQYVYEN